MTDSDDLLIHSNILLGAINAAMVIAVYVGIIFLTHLFLVEVHDINIIQMITQSISLASIPFIAKIMEFLGFLFENVIIDTIILALFYAAYISNYEIKIEKDTLTLKKGFLIVDVDEIKLDNIEQVYTERYTFFYSTKQLCMRTLDEDIIKIPYVPNADELKKILIEKVKAYNAHIKTTEELHAPVRSVALNPQ